MPSEEWLRRMEALNGGPLREAVAVSDEPEPIAALDEPVAVVRTAARPSDRLRPLRGAPISLADAITGIERTVPDHGAYFHVERLVADHASGCEELGHGVCRALPGVRSGRTRRAQSPPQPHEVVFFDIETLGLDVGSPIFLFGLVGIDGENRAVCRQVLSRTFEEEAAGLAAAAELIGQARLLVTFNGRAFDMPLLRSRARAYNIAIREPSAHVDMLLEARKRYARKLPNCRLQTLEARVCGRTREDDVPSRRIPGVYRQFVKTGDARLLQKVVHHNLVDLATTAELFTLFFG